MNFLTEGEIDALTLKQALASYLDNFGVAATGSVSFSRMLIEELNAKYETCTDKPQFIWVGDNDEAGRNGAEKIVSSLNAAGYPAVNMFFADASTEKIDANKFLQEKGEEVLRGFLLDAVENTAAELGQQAKEIQERVKQEQIAEAQKHGVTICSLSDYFAEGFDTELDKVSKYAGRATGFENIDMKQLFLPGLYILGGTPGAGKTTFAWQLLSNLAEGDADKFRDAEHCVYCSYEMSKSELFTKSIVRELYKRYPAISERLKLSSVNIRRGACKDIEELHKQATLFARSSTNLRVVELSNTGIAELTEKLKPLVADVDKSAVICLDYLQIVPSKDDRPSSAKEKVDDIMLRLKDFQRETESTLIVISSLNRASYIGEAKISSFKESGAIEYSADVLWQLANYVASGAGDNEESAKRIGREKVRPIKLSCLKNRNGGQYDCFFRYHAAHDYFKATKEDEIFEEKRERPKHER